MFIIANTGPASREPRSGCFFKLLSRDEGSRSMRTDDFDFALPPERIALRPVSPRDAARLLVVRPGGGGGGGGEFEDRIVRDLPDLLQPGDRLVVNDTKVIAAQLSGRRLGRPP